MKVLFINPPWIKGNRVGIRAGSRWPYTQDKWGENDTVPFPFSLAYSASLSREHNFEIAIIDGVAEKISLDKFWEKFRKNISDVVVFEISTPSYFQDREIMKEIKMLYPDIILVVCGTHASVFPKEVLEENPADIVLIGEYEYTILELVKKLQKKESIQEILGIAFRRNGEIKVNPRRPLIKNLDFLPYPERDLTPIYQYNDWFCKYKPNVQLHASRGCVFGCSFCAWPRIIYGGRNYRKRDPKKVIDEIEFLQKNYKFEEFYFDDDTFNIDIEHTKNICNEIKNRNMKINWSFMGHTGNLTKEILKELRSSGCEGIKFGVETGDEQILKLLNKGTTLEKTRNVFKWCKETGIRTHATFTFGLPGETKESLKKSIDLLLELSPETLQVSYTTPLPGTKLFDEAKKNNWLTTYDWSKYDGSCSSVIKTDGIYPNQIEDLYFELLEKWHKHLFIKDIIDNKKKYFCKAILHPMKAVKFVIRNFFILK